MALYDLYLWSRDSPKMIRVSNLDSVKKETIRKTWLDSIKNGEYIQVLSGNVPWTNPPIIHDITVDDVMKLIESKRREGDVYGTNGG